MNYIENVVLLQKQQQQGRKLESAVLHKNIISLIVNENNDFQSLFMVFCRLGTLL